MVWFEANEPEDCREAPEEVSEEALPTDICDGVSNIYLNLAQIIPFQDHLKIHSKYHNIFVYSMILFQAAAKDKRCFCIGYNYTTYFYGQPQESSEEITYLPWCGVCRDPCALQFKWDASFTILPGIVIFIMIYV